MALSSEERLRCLAYIEAVWLEDAAGKAALVRTGPGERELATLLAVYGEAMMQVMVTSSFGMHDGMGPEQLLAASDRMQQDVGARYAAVFGEALRLWSTTAVDTAVEHLARIVAAIVLYSTPDSTEDDLLPFLAQLRAAEQ